jgi:tyrosyl-tRNA synthetase
MKSAREQLKVIKRGIMELIPEDEFIAKLGKGRPLKIKWGADPSAPDIHLGHTIILNKLRQLQDLGHEVIFLIGDFTARIGDPTGKSETRKPLTKDEVKQNARTYQDQAFKILDKKRTKVVYNSKWLSPLKIDDVITLAGKYTVARMLERDDFMNRFEKERPISIHEFLYPLIQGYDSVELEADLEVGGTDQKFNMLVGRELQREFREEPQCILTLPLLEGTDGVQKMSKTFNNYIGVTDSPKEIYGKTMSISDQLMLRYYELLTDESVYRVKALHPLEAKKALASLLVTKFYDRAAADQAQAEFESVFSKGNLPEDMKTKKLSKAIWNAKDLLCETGLAASGSEAKRIIQQGGFKVEGQTLLDVNAEVDISKPKILQKGKRDFLRVEKK